MLVDVNLGSESGFELARRLVAHFPRLGSSVVLISTGDHLDPPARDLVLHGYSFLVAMMIGLGVGLTAAVVAAVANRVRTAGTTR